MSGVLVLSTRSDADADRPSESLGGERPTSGRSEKSLPTRAPDPRYGTERWRKVRKLVLQRDHWECRIAPGCPERASVADHIEPASPAMTDEQFYDPRNLRAACRDHNILRGKAARLERETRGGPSAVITGDYS